MFGQSSSTRASVKMRGSGKRNKKQLLTSRQAVQRNLAAAAQFRSGLERLENRQMFSAFEGVSTSLIWSMDSSASQFVDVTAPSPATRRAVAVTTTDTSSTPTQTTDPVLPSDSTAPGPSNATDPVATDVATTGSTTGSTTTDTTTADTTTADPALATPMVGPVLATDAAVSDPTAAAASGTPTQVHSPSDFRYILRPGSGFSGATGTPAARGTGLGATEPVITDWDTVPYQVVGKYDASKPMGKGNGSLNIGLVAWHINSAGIDHVDFSVNGGPWTSVASMALNPDTGSASAPNDKSKWVNEYYTTLRADQFTTAGPVEIRAIAYPVVGQPVVLPSMMEYVDPAGTLASKVRYVDGTNGNDTSGNGTQGSPYKTIAKAASSFGSSADGGTIYLAPGTYDGSTNVTTNNAMLTIAAMPGVSRSQVVLTGPGGSTWFGGGSSASGTPRLVHFDGVTVSAGVPSPSLGALPYVWFSNDDMTDGDRYASNSGSTWYWEQPVFVSGQTDPWVNHGYITDSHVFGTHEGASHITLNRNVKIDDLAGVALDGCATMINVDVSDISHVQQPLVHSDVYHGYARTNGVILYGVTATAGGVTEPGGTPVTRVFNFFETGSIGGNLAVINCVGDTAGGWGTALELAKVDNALIKNSQFIGGSTIYANTTITNTVFENVQISADPTQAPGITVR